MTKRARLTEADRQLWARYAERVAPLAGRTPPPPPLPAALSETTIASAPPAPAVAPPPKTKQPSLAVGDQPGGLDRATWHRLRTGRMTPARTLDLHGRTAERAFHALASFLHSAQADGLRCVEVITGRGTGDTGGVIRREFPHWLNRPDLRPLVLAASHPHPANPGSVRVLLRRRR